MSDTSPASERNFCLREAKLVPPQLSALLSEISAVSANEWCKTADNTGMWTV